MPQGSLRALMPALANKTYFNKTALPNAMLQTNCPAVSLGEHHCQL